MAFQITGVSVACSIICLGADQRKHQRSASLAFVRGIYRWPMDSPHQGLITRIKSPFDNVFMWTTAMAIFLWYNLGLKPDDDFASPMRSRHLTSEKNLATGFMMTSSNGNIFCFTGPLCGEFTGYRWIPRTKTGSLMFSLICAWINRWVNNREAGDWRRNRAHCDVIVIYGPCMIVSSQMNENLLISNSKLTSDSQLIWWR